MRACVRVVLTAEEMARSRAIRREVLVGEKGVPDAIEADDLDAQCAHFLAFPAEDAPLEAAIGTARMFPQGARVAKAQRVAVLASARGTGAGAALMVALEAEARRRGHAEVRLTAQIDAVPFYLRIGYAAEGELFEEAGIPHLWMHKALG